MSNATTTPRSRALQSQIDRVCRRTRLDAEIAAARESLSIRLTHVTNISNPQCMAELSIAAGGESQLKISRSPSEHAVVLDEAAVLRLRDFLVEHFPATE